MPAVLRHLDAAAVRSALPWPALVNALRQAFVAGCEVPPRHAHAIGQAGTALLMPAWRTGGALGVKTVTIFPGNGARGLPGVSEIAVWNRHPEAAEQLATALREQGFGASLCVDLEAAVRQADIVSCATLSTQALVRGDWLPAGAHLDLIGSFAPHMREGDGNCFARSRVFVDTEEALAKAGDVLQAVAEGHFEHQVLQGTLATLCRGQATGRRGAGEITLFKSVGTALEDLAAAELVLHAADNPRFPD